MKTARFLPLVVLLSASLFVVAQTPAPPAQPVPQPQVAPQQRPPDAPAAAERVRQGRQLEEQGKLDEALNAYRSALEAAPNYLEAHMAAGAVLDLKGDYAAAQKMFNRAIVLADQQRVQALRNMAFSHAFAGDGKKAGEYAKQVFDIRMAANNFESAAGAANEGARLLLETGNVDEAEKWYRLGYETALRVAGQTPAQRALWDFRWHHAQARIAARRGQHAEAQKHLAPAKAALDATGDADQQAYYPYLVGYLAFYAGDYANALTELAKSDQEDPFILSLMAQAHEKQGNQAKAMELYRQILKTNWHNPTNAFARPLAQKKAGGEHAGH